MLEGPDRDAWQKPDLIMDALRVGKAPWSPTSAPAAAGSPCDSRGASAPTASSTREDIQAEMLEAIGRRVQREGFRNVQAGARRRPTIRSSLPARSTPR